MISERNVYPVLDALDKAIWLLGTLCTASNDSAARSAQRHAADAFAELLGAVAPTLSAAQVRQRMLGEGEGEGAQAAISWLTAQATRVEDATTDALWQVTGVTNVDVARWVDGRNEETSAPHWRVTFATGYVMSVIPHDGRLSRWVDDQTWSAAFFDPRGCLAVDPFSEAGSAGTGGPEIVALAMRYAAIFA